MTVADLAAILATMPADAEIKIGTQPSHPIGHAIGQLAQATVDGRQVVVLEATQADHMGAAEAEALGWR